MPIDRSFNRRHLVGAGLALSASALVAGSVVTSAHGGTSSPGATPASASGTQADGSWLFIDDLGIEIRLPSAPQRIVAELSAAAALWDLGIRPIGVWGLEPGQEPTENLAGRIDFTTTEDLGPGFTGFDVERLVGIEPDLIIASAYSSYASRYWRLDPDAVPQIQALAPVLGVLVTDVPQNEVIERYVRAANALGADTDSTGIATARAAYLDAQEALRAAVAAKRDLTVVPVSGSTDSFYIGNQNVSSDLRLFAELGVNLPDTDNKADTFLLLSWEEADTYPADVLLVDRRSFALPYEDMLGFGSFASLPAVVANQVGNWNLEYVDSYQGFVPILQELTALITASRDDLV